MFLVDASGDGPAAFATLYDAARAAGRELTYVGPTELPPPAPAVVVLDAGLAHDGPRSRRFFDRLAEAQPLAVFGPPPLLPLALAALGLDDDLDLDHPLGAHPLAGTYDTTLLPPRRAPVTGTFAGARFTTRRGGVVFGDDALLRLTGASEPFRIMPLDPQLADELVAAVHAELVTILGGGGPSTRAPEPILPGLMWRKTAWLELTALETAPAPLLIEACVRTRLDAVWLSISPNRFFRPGDRFFARQAAMWTSVERFTAALAAATPTPPDVLVAFHPADNFTCPPFPPRPARDVYGRTFVDVPAPLERAWWRAQVEAPLAWFAAEWRRRSALPLGGVVLDLELYLRKVSGVSYFLGTLDGEDEAAARALGHELGEAIRAHVPHLAVYLASLHSGWFYRGFLPGLGGGRPLPTFSFNSRYRGSPYPAPIAHASPLMLSKLRHLEDVERARAILTYNHGLWLNRLSRAGDPYEPTAWHVLEQTPLPLEARGELWDRIGAL